MVVADQNDIRAAHNLLQLWTVQQGFVILEGMIEFLKIFPPIVGILRADLALDSRQRGQLRRAAPQSKIGCGRHNPVLVPLTSPSPVHMLRCSTERIRFLPEVRCPAFLPKI